MMKPLIEMDGIFKGSQLRLARHYWGKTLNDIAEDIGKTRQYVSQLENGKGKLREDDPITKDLALSLQVAPTFFFKPVGVSLSEEQAHFRKLATTKASMKQKVLARGTIFDQLVEFIDTKVRLPAVDFPDESGAETTEEIEQAAERLRAYWGLGFGPISHMVRVVERAGAVVTFFQDTSTEVDALSITSRRPVIVRNEAKQSPFRLRFDIAHELGHLVLHEGQVTGDRKTESEANRFASAFLIPRSTFLKAFPRRGSRLDWVGISKMKMDFQVSKAAIIYRAKALGLIDDYQYRGAVIYLKNQGEGITEKEDPLCVREQPETVTAALKVLYKHHGITHDALAAHLGITPGFLSEVLPTPLGTHEEVMLPSRPALQLVK
ncbi:Zn-dependent peptidase ImmA (M78 family)/transcriptional regulator with XRE-family HTH domain [Pseudomonas corrugata]|uniref:XRE family transcriptional regulator n=1 Tax=Pseudomonas corrugata TaxID=47879 RepID=UPI0028642A5B|nr:XRE family transcriptional regulator [Pseudomonas corrugata]MDR7281495.1 Zn-dependent peptidase ImmA (M78 family)/transcriptional regulator with XRE-family HTH domain [Pseudomonas corrugata]